MSVYSPTYHAMVFSPDPAPAAVQASATAGTATATGSGSGVDSFFHHLWNVVNPLQHLPVVGTIYRAITGEHIAPVEKIAGDALYGGLWGAVSSVAEVAFESVAGKSPEDMALAWIKGDDSTAVTSAKVSASPVVADAGLPSSDLPALPTDTAGPQLAANGAPTPLDNALAKALSAKGVDNDTAARALYAYRRSMGMTAPAPMLASVN